MVTKCVVPNCGNSCNTKLSVTLFSFPKDPELARKWLQATRARGVKQIKSHHKVCSKHFEKHLILDNFGATRLEPGSLPTIFEWNRKPAVKTDLSPLVNRSNPFLTVENVSELPQYTYSRLILPKPAPGQPAPKVRIPPLVKRVAVLSSQNNRTLDCDVILPDERISVGQKLPCTRMSPVRELPCPGYERIASKISSLHVSDDDSNGPVHVGHHIEEYDNSDCPLIEVDAPLSCEIDPLSSESDVLLDRSEPLAGEVIIEECSIIEDEIMQSHQVDEPAVTFLEKDSASENTSNVDFTTCSETALPDEASGLDEHDVTNVPTSSETAQKSEPTSQNVSAESSYPVALIQKLPKNIVFLQFDAQTGSCTENPDLKDLSARDIASIRKSLSSSQSSKVVILKNGGPAKSKVIPAGKVSPISESYGKRPCERVKVQPILPKGANSNLPQKSAVSSSPSVVTLSKNDVMAKLNAAGSPAYFIPQGGHLTSTLLLQNSTAHNQINPVKPTSSSVPVSQSVANFLIATPTSSSLVSGQNAASTPAVSPLVYQLGNMVPVNSTLTQKPPQVSSQNNSVKIVAPQMTYLIPIGGAIPQPLAPKSTSSNGVEKSTTQKRMGNLCNAAMSKKRRKLTKDDDEDDNDDEDADVVHPSSPICISSSSSCSDVEQRLLKQVGSLKMTLRRKVSTIQELKKENNTLSKKLKLLGMAFGKMRKASMLNLATSRFLEGVDDQVASNMTLDLKDLGREGKLGDVVSTIHYLSRILHDQVKSKVLPDGKRGRETENCQVKVKVEPAW